MTVHDMSIVDVKSATGWSLGWAAHCEPCDYWGQPHDRASQALIDCNEHTRKTEET